MQFSSRTTKRLYATHSNKYTDILHLKHQFNKQDVNIDYHVGTIFPVMLWEYVSEEHIAVCCFWTNEMTEWFNDNVTE